MEKKAMMNVYAGLNGTNGKRDWERWGAAFTNKDGSINLKLNVLPCGGVPLVVTETKAPDAEMGPTDADSWRVLTVVKIKGREKGIWIQIGTALRTRHGFRVLLDGVPTDKDNATLQLRPPRDAEQTDGAPERATDAAPAAAADMPF